MNLRQRAEVVIARYREVFVNMRAHLQARHGCANFDDFDVEKCEWPPDHADVLLASSVEEKPIGKDE